MSDVPLPLVIEPTQLESLLDDPRLLIVDLGRATTYADLHVPGAVFLDYAQIAPPRLRPDADPLPSEEQLSRVFSALGLTPDSHVVAYDDEGGGKAARLLWTLELVGHRRYSLLNGGLHAWANEGHPHSRAPANRAASQFQAVIDPHSEVLATRDYLLAHLGDPQVAVVDARSAAEYQGVKRFAARGGHIPGAVHMDWVEAMDHGRNLRLKDPQWLTRHLAERGVTPERTVVAYCQTHHRSAHTWLVLKWLGFRAKGYAGSWAEWGNRGELPVEV